MATKEETPGAASSADNKRLQHSAGGVSTRDDALDNGAPMLQGQADEPVGPEDALGKGPKRGDYSKLIGERQFSQTVPNPDWDPKNPDAAPRFLQQHQNPNVSDIGDAKGKGGVSTAR